MKSRLLIPLGLLAALLVVTPPAQDEPCIVFAADDPSGQLTAELARVLADALPPSTTSVVLFRDCAERLSCEGQVPDWFEHTQWLRGLERSSLPLVPLELSVGRSTLERIDQSLQGQPQARVQDLLGELHYVQDVNALLYIRPEANPDSIIWDDLQDKLRGSSGHWCAELRNFGSHKVSVSAAGQPG